MRDYKFRGKRIDNREWVEGCYAEFINYLDGNSKPGIQVTKQVPSEFDRMVPAWETELVEVIPETVGQFTGLPDKNGVEIYEGDIINGFSMEMTAYEIKYGSDASFYGESAPYFGIPGAGTQTAGLNNISDWANVIGNIHDNPELLGGKRMEG